MPLPAAEHRLVKAETRAVRNALAKRRLREHAEAMAWCDALGATRRTADNGRQLWYIVTAPGFTRCPGYGRTLAEAVEALDANIANFCDHGLTQGPTRVNIGPLCAARRAFLGRAK